MGFIFDTDSITPDSRSSSGGGSGGGEYPLTRILDDNGNEIGTAFTEFTDANGNKFKVICLDAQYRKASTQWCSEKNTIVTDLPMYYNSLILWWYDNAKETATQNTQLILDYCSTNNYTSTVCEHCRSQSFVINGTTYYGQLPNIRELFDLWRHRVQIEQMDTSANSYSSTNFSSPRDIWSSTQCDNTAWYISTKGNIHTFNKIYKYLACPILEIPL